ncbi:MAG: carbon-nitrogen hydrolase family protein [Planctomycetes bacterium]|nr:carbon-nitrogen hydrolase family protein [Planctomycetota bacterium]
MAEQNRRQFLALALGAGGLGALGALGWNDRNAFIEGAPDRGLAPDADPARRTTNMHENPRLKSTSDQLPRKVIVGTSRQAFRPPYPGLEKRLDDLGALLDRMAAASRTQYGRGLDLAVLPEMAVTGGLGGWEADAFGRSLPFEGPIQSFFERKARDLGAYLVLPMNRMDSQEERRVSNVAMLLDRKGKVAGVYNKIHLAARQDRDALEDGVTPGKNVPVFECDFGKLGIQLCFDVMFDEGWRELASAGAEIVAWPTFRPGTIHGMARSLAHRYYIVSSTWDSTAHIFEPTGKIVAQAKPNEPVLVQELDLSYAIITSGGGRPGENGDGFVEKFGERVGFRFYPEEAWGLFWSNDPKMSIGAMCRSIKAVELESELARVRALYRNAGLCLADS